MDDPRLSELRALARAGLISRREVLTRGLQLGLSLPAIAALMQAAPASAAPQPRRRAILPRPQNGNGGTFTYLRDGSTPDLDPHYAYDNAAQAIILGAYEMLIQYKGASTDEYEPMLAEEHAARRDILAAFDEGLRAFYAGRFDEARARFAAIAERDPPAAAYAEKCLQLAASPPEYPCDGVWQMTSK